MQQQHWPQYIIIQFITEGNAGQRDIDDEDDYTLRL